MTKIITNFPVTDLTNAEDLVTDILTGNVAPVEAECAEYGITDHKLDTAFGKILNCLTLTGNTFCIWDTDTNSYEMYNDRTPDHMDDGDPRYYVQLVRNVKFGTLDALSDYCMKACLVKTVLVTVQAESEEGWVQEFTWTVIGAENFECLEKAIQALEDDFVKFTFEVK